MFVGLMAGAMYLGRLTAFSYPDLSLSLVAFVDYFRSFIDVKKGWWSETRAVDVEKGGWAKPRG